MKGWGESVSTVCVGKDPGNCIQYLLTLVLFTFSTCCTVRCVVCVLLLLVLCVLLLVVLCIVVSCVVCNVSCVVCIVVVVLCVLL